METKELKFKTNINCDGCIAKVTPALNAAQGIKACKVDSTNPKKILSVSTDQLNAEDIISVVQKAGYKAEVAG